MGARGRHGDRSGALLGESIEGFGPEAILGGRHIALLWCRSTFDGPVGDLTRSFYCTHTHTCPVLPYSILPTYTHARAISGRSTGGPPNSAGPPPSCPRSTPVRSWRWPPSSPVGGFAVCGVDTIRTSAVRPKTKSNTYTYLDDEHLLLHRVLDRKTEHLDVAALAQAVYAVDGPGDPRDGWVDGYIN